MNEEREKGLLISWFKKFVMKKKKEESKVVFIVRNSGTGPYYLEEEP